MKSPKKRSKGPLRAAAVAVGISLIVTAGAGYFVTGLVRDFNAQLEAARQSRPVEIDVPVATRDLPLGAVIGPEDLATLRIDRDYLPASVQPDAARLLGRTVRWRILAGESIRDERLAPPEAGNGLNAVLADGERALSVNLKDGAQVSGFIEPGNVVDVIVTIPEDKDLGRAAETRTITQTVRVLAVNEKIAETAQGEEIRTPQVTLALRQADAERLIHAIVIGRVTLALRSEIDLHERLENPTTTASLIGRSDHRLTVVEFRERVSEAELTHMLEVVLGPERKREKVVDPHLLRPIEEPE